MFLIKDKSLPMHVLVFPRNEHLIAFYNWRINQLIARSNKK